MIDRLPVEEMSDEELGHEIAELVPQVVANHQPGVRLTVVTEVLERYPQLKAEQARRLRGRP